MKHDLNKNLEAQKSEWSPSPDNVATMLNTAHHRAASIKSFRRKAIAAVSMVSIGGLLWLTQMPSQLPDTEPAKVIAQETKPVIKETLTKKAIDAEAKQEKKDERAMLLALADAQSFAMEDFDFIEETLTSPYSQLLADY